MHVEHYSSLTDMGDIGFSLCGYEDCNADFYHNGGQVYHDSYLIHLITRGSGFYALGEKQYHLNTGDFFIIFRTDSVRYWPEGDGWSFCWFAFRGENAAEYLTRAGYTRENPVGTLRDPQAFRACIERMIALTVPRRQQENILQIKAALYEALGCICRESMLKHPPQPQTQKANYVRQALVYIENNYHRSVSTDDIARYLSLDPGYFTRLFRKDVGLPPNRYLNQYRLGQACNALVATSAPVTEIATQCGFPNTNYFFRIFRRVYHCTPCEYRSIKQKRQNRVVYDDNCSFPVMLSPSIITAESSPITKEKKGESKDENG